MISDSLLPGEEKEENIVSHTDDQKHEFNHLIIKYMVVTTDSHHSDFKSTIG